MRKAGTLPVYSGSATGWAWILECGSPVAHW
jgi:hypothetical protein